MTNGDKIRKTGDTDLANGIMKYCRDNIRCRMCNVGMDDKNRCKDPNADCVESIFDWLGEEYVKNDK